MPPRSIRLHTMRVLITGGAGFIGSHLADALLAQGDQVVILDNLTTGSRANIAHIENQIEIHQGDIRDEALVNDLVKSADLVLHMAAALGVNTILESPLESILLGNILTGIFGFAWLYQSPPECLLRPS